MTRIETTNPGFRGLCWLRQRYAAVCRCFRECLPATPLTRFERASRPVVGFGVSGHFWAQSSGALVQTWDTVNDNTVFVWEGGSQLVAVPE